MNRRVLRLVAHDPEWAQDFLAEKSRIVTTLQDPAVEVEHVGSTSIPLVHAKPILDLAILCGDKGLEPLAEALSYLGYEYRGPYGDIEGHYYAVLDCGDVRFCQAHICTSRNAEWHSKLLFRDVLRRSSDLAKEYDHYKLRLAATTLDKRRYAEIKSDWIDSFIPRVRQVADSRGS